MAAIAQHERSGFWNLLARENRVWWRSKRWLIQLLVSVAGLGGFLGVTLFILPGMAEATGESIDALSAGTQIFFGMGAFALAIDLIILTQNTIIGEKQSGIAEWVLSKPVSRPAYILAKFLSNAFGALVTLILVPGAVAYALFGLAGAAIPPATFAGALALLALHTLFYLALSLLMGVLVDSQGPLLAVTLGSVLGGAALVNFIGPLALVTPWPLGSLAIALANQAALPALAWLPVAATIVLLVAALIIAIWRFEKAEL